MNDTPAFRPYTVPRHLDQDAWLLYETTSIPYYEQCAWLCEDFADFFNRLVTEHSARGTPRVDYWVSRYLNHAENIRRGIEFVKVAGDYMPMYGFLNAPQSDWRGLIENAFGYAIREEWQPKFDPLSLACGLGVETLLNNEWNGLSWANRNKPGEDLTLLDRDDGPKGDLARLVEIGVEGGVLVRPAEYPRYAINRSVTGKPGQRCPRSGVWVPEQGIEGFSLAFCIEGRPMQPAYRILGEEPDFLDIYHKVTRAEDTTWFFVEKADAVTEDAGASQGAPARGRCEAGRPCPQEGYWFTPAQASSRRRFKSGEVMPETGGEYGATIWQWDSNQSK